MSDSRLLTECDIRNVAVEVVDTLHGYTLEFSDFPLSHEQDYIEVESILRRVIFGGSGDAGAHDATRDEVGQ